MNNYLEFIPIIPPNNPKGTALNNILKIWGREKEAYPRAKESKRITPQYKSEAIIPVRYPRRFVLREAKNPDKKADKIDMPARNTLRSAVLTSTKVIRSENTLINKMLITNVSKMDMA